MDLTPNYGLGKPLVGENYDVGVPNANMDIIDATLKSHADSIENSGTSIDARLDVLEAKFTTAPAVITNLFVAATGWSIQDQRCYVWGPFLFGNLQVVRTGATLVSNSNGNIGNITAANWASGKDAYKPIGAAEAAWLGGATGAIFGGYISAGSAAIGSLAPGTAGNVETGEVLSGSFSYIRAM